jgi:hypothetical protein
VCSREDDPSVHDDPNKGNSPRSPIGSGPESVETDGVIETLKDFLRFLDRHSDAFDPVMITASRELNKSRYMSDELINDFVSDYVEYVRNA